MHKGRYVHTPTYSAKVLSPAVDLIPKPSFASLITKQHRIFIARKNVFCLDHCSHHDFVKTSYSKYLHLKHKCRMFTEWVIVPLYICNFLENRFSGHGTFVMSTVVFHFICWHRVL